MDLDKAIAERAVLLAGDEDVLRTETLHELILKARGDGDPCDEETIDADARDPMDWFGAASTSPFLSERRIVIVRHVSRINPSEVDEDFAQQFKERLEALPDYAFLVLVVDSPSGSENRQRTMQTNAGRWMNLAKKAGLTTLEFKADPKSSQDAIRKRAKEKGLKIANKAAALLSEMCAHKTGIALLELEKLELFAGKGGEITERHVEQVVAPEFDYNVYRLIDAVVAGNQKEAVVQLRTLARQHDRPEAQTFSRIFPVMQGQLRLLWQARLCVEAGSGWQRPPESVTSAFPARDRLDKRADWQANRAMRSARNAGLPQIRHALRTLSRIDRELKGMKQSADPYESLERGVQEMASRFGKVSR